MNIEREGIIFDCYFVPGTRDTLHVQGDPHELVIESHKITNHAAMVAEYGNKSVADIIEQEYESLLEEAEAAYFADNEPDEAPEPEFEYEGD